MDTGECGTDQHLVATHIGFEWPCHKRRSHGPHKRTKVGDIHRDGGWYPVYDNGQGVKTEDGDCPGVKAHPATMIGR